MVKTKWLIYTVIIGLMPFIIRFLVYISHTGRSVDFLFSEIDFIIFGLVLNLSNINELEDKTDLEKVWRSKNIGYSVILIIIISSILGIAYFREIGSTELDKTVIRVCSAILSCVSFLVGYSIFNRINAIANGKY